VANNLKKENDMERKLEQCVCNLVNGNLKEARRQAKNLSVGALTDFMKYELGWTTDKALAASEYLKTGKKFQLYCDEA
jgi:hypothetical protein